MQRVKKLVGKLFSMRAAILLLVLLSLACVAGSVITQGESASYYSANYPEKLAQLILLIDLDDVFHCVWFVALTILLVLNLLGCNLVRFPGILRHMKDGFRADERLKARKPEEEKTLNGDPKTLFSAMGFKNTTETTVGSDKAMYAVRNRFGLWGAWLTHLGMLIIIVGFALGQMFTVKYTVYGVPGQTKPVEGTDYTLTIDSFEIGLREDETVEQYTSRVTMTDSASGTSKSGEISVNHPTNLFGMKLYQNSTGWAATVTVLENEEQIQQEVLCAGEYLEISTKPGLVVSFTAFYPDYVQSDSGMPATASSQLNNPGYLYTVYYNGNVIGMNVLVDDYITIDDYTVTFSDPQQYTLIQLKKDPYMGITLVGAIVIMFAIFIAFYCRTEELWAIQTEAGWSVGGFSRKGGVLFRDKLTAKIGELNGEKTKGAE